MVPPLVRCTARADAGNVTPTALAQATIAAMTAHLRWFVSGPAYQIPPRLGRNSASFLTLARRGAPSYKGFPYTSVSVTESCVDGRSHPFSRHPCAAAQLVHDVL